MKLSAEIVNVRAHMGMSQQAFATHIGAGIASLQRWESGKQRPREYGHVSALIEAGVPAKCFNYLRPQKVGAPRVRRQPREKVVA